VASAGVFLRAEATRERPVGHDQPDRLFRCADKMRVLCRQTAAFAVISVAAATAEDLELPEGAVLADRPGSRAQGPAEGRIGMSRRARARRSCQARRSGKSKDWKTPQSALLSEKTRPSSGWLDPGRALRL